MMYIISNNEKICRKIDYLIDVVTVKIIINFICLVWKVIFRWSTFPIDRNIWAPNGLVGYFYGMSTLVGLSNAEVSLFM